MQLKSRKILTDLEDKIRSGNIRMLEIFIETGVYLRTIRNDELFKEDGYNDFADYVNGCGKFDFDADHAKFRIRCSETFSLIEDLRKKQPAELRDSIKLPQSQSVLKPLLSMSPDRLQDTWFELCQHADKTGAPISGEYVRDWVKRPLSLKESANNKDSSVSKTVRDIDFSSAPKSVNLSQGSHICLDRIQSLSLGGMFPPNFRWQIETETTLQPIKSYHLETWNKHQDADFIRLGRLLLYGLSFDEADRFVLKDPVIPKELVYAAIANGGSASFRVDDRFRVTIEPVPAQ